MRTANYHFKTKEAMQHVTCSMYICKNKLSFRVIFKQWLYPAIQTAINIIHWIHFCKGYVNIHALLVLLIINKAKEIQKKIFFYFTTDEQYQLCIGRLVNACSPKAKHTSTDDLVKLLKHKKTN